MYSVTTPRYKGVLYNLPLKLSDFSLSYNSALTLHYRLTHLSLSLYRSIDFIIHISSLFLSSTAAPSLLIDCCACFSRLLLLVVFSSAAAIDQLQMALRQIEGEKLEIEPDPATWSALEEKIFIQLMVKEVHNGNRSSATFSRKGWNHIEHEFCERTNKRYNNSQFRNKYNQLRTRYHDFSKLLKEPGFTWDPVLSNVTAADAVWESYIKVNKNAQRFRKKGCPAFNELDIIFGDPVSKFKDVFPLGQYPLENEDKFDLEDESTNATPSAFPNDSSDGKDYPTLSAGRRRQRSLTPTSHLQAKRVARTAVVGEVLKEGTEVTVPSGTYDKQWAEATIVKTPTLDKFDGFPQCSAFSITNCVKCLESIEGVDVSTYLKAIKMFKDVDWREMFMAMSAERRFAWLASLE